MIQSLSLVASILILSSAGLTTALAVIFGQAFSTAAITVGLPLACLFVGMTANSNSAELLSSQWGAAISVADGTIALFTAVDTLRKRWKARSPNTLRGVTRGAALHSIAGGVVVFIKF